jgi:ribose transport system substrate-binding protein
VSEQQRFIEDILVQNFDGMAICAINPDAMTPILDRVAAKMPVVVHDSDAPKSQRKAFVGTDNVAAGKLAGQAAIEALKAANITKGKVAMFVGRIDMQNSIDRKKGIDDTLGKQPGIEILPIYLDGADRTKAKKNVEDALARFPDLVMTIGLWSYNGPCMVDAVKGSTRKKKPLVVAFDEEEETLKAVDDGTIYATIVQRPFQFGYQSMKALKDVKDGKTIPTFIDTTIQKIDKSNLTAFWTELKEMKK